MNKIEFIKEIRSLEFDITDIKEDEFNKLRLGLKLAKEIADKVWQLKEALK